MTKKDLVEIIEDCVYNSQVLIGERVCFDELRKELNEEVPEQLILTDVVSCVCKIPEPRLKVSENGTHAYCNNCAKTYWQK
jgi:hypothetical protein